MQSEISDLKIDVDQVPVTLYQKLECVDCRFNPLAWDASNEALICPSCKAKFPVKNGVPSLKEGGPEQQDWNPWTMDEVLMTGHSYFQRATGALPEKEASKSYANLMKAKGYHTPGGSLLDIGCATGHFLRSFRRILDPEIRYTGIDTEMAFLQWGREAYGLDETCSFVQGNALVMPFEANAFDNVVVNLFHFFPRADLALKEAMRVAKNRVIWRTPIGEANYIVKAIYTPSFEELGVLSPDREDLQYTLTMMYTKPYIEGLVKHLGGRIDLFERDEDFGEFDNTALADFKNCTATKTMNGMQVNGNLILDWQYVVIDCLTS